MPNYTTVSLSWKRTAVLVVVSAVILATIKACGHSPLSRWDFQKISKGMDILEVKQILGPENGMHQFANDFNGRQALEWVRNGTRITVYFDENGRVENKVLEGARDDILNGVLSVWDSDPDLDAARKARKETESLFFEPYKPAPKE